MPLGPITLIGEQKKVLFLPPTKPIQIKGVAGSGKTTVALYRAKHLLETQNTLFDETKIIIFTYNTSLAEYIRAVSPFINGGYQKDSNQIVPRTPDGLNGIEIINFHKKAFREIGLVYGQTIMQWEQLKIISTIINSYTSEKSNILSKSSEFFQEEFSWIKGKLFSKQNEYIDAKRTGRGTSDRVTKIDKEVIWFVFEKYKEKLLELKKVDFDDYAILWLNKINNTTNFQEPYTHIIIDEAQDLNKAQILTIKKLVSKNTESITIIADAAQRIYKSGFNWTEVGLEVRGRTIEFKKNYRNTIEIAKAAASLLQNETDNEDFTEIQYSIRNGEKPKVAYYYDFNEQLKHLDNQLISLKNNNNLSSTVILHRSNNGVREIKNYLDANGQTTELIKSNQKINYDSDSVKICTMSSIKGLEFNNVFIIDLNDDIIPYPPGFIETDDEFHISTERRLLYTCMTRARNKLFLFSSDTPTRYLKEIDRDLLNDISPKKTTNYSDDLPF